MKEETKVFFWTDEEGNEFRFILLEEVSIGDQRYGVLMDEVDAINDNDDFEVFIYNIKKDEDGEDILVEIEEDEEFNNVCDYLDEMNEDDLEEE